MYDLPRSRVCRELSKQKMPFPFLVIPLDGGRPAVKICGPGADPSTGAEEGPNGEESEPSGVGSGPNVAEVRPNEAPAAE